MSKRPEAAAFLISLRQFLIASAMRYPSFSFAFDADLRRTQMITRAIRESNLWSLSNCVAFACERELKNRSV